MNELQYIDTLENGNSLLFFPHGGHLFYWEAIDWGVIRLHTVDTVSDEDQEYTVWDSFEDLPARVRQAVSTSQYDMRSTKATLEGVMHGD